MNDPQTIAYLSMEVGLESAMLTYSGGLSVLAGDLGLPFVALNDSFFNTQRMMQQYVLIADFR